MRPNTCSVARLFFTRRAYDIGNGISRKIGKKYSILRERKIVLYYELERKNAKKTKEKARH